MSDREPSTTFYVTTPIYYVNDRPHIGHLYTTTLADILARHYRMRGMDVFFLTGTDEHAAKVADSAAQNNMKPIEWADRNAAIFEQTFTRLGMSNDDFIRTSQPRHTEKVTGFIQRLLETGDVYEGDYEGWYDAGQEEYVPDSKAKEYDFRSPINGKPLIRKTERNFFFRLSKYQQALLDLLEQQPRFVQPDSRRNEVLARIREGLNDVPVSRTGSGGWGIAMPGGTDQTIYVWIDALFNYLTTVDTAERRKYWPADVHLIAKDILWFHAVIWPALLLALKQPMPKQVYAHSFWISEGQKMSKSLGNFIDLEKIDSYVEQFGLDALRWFLATQGPMGSTDSDFSHDRFVDVYNTDLANTLGNCTSRVTNMINRYFEGVLPEAAAGYESREALQLRSAAQETCEKVRVLYDQVAIGAANQAAMELVRAIDFFIEQTQPFKMAKDPAQRERLSMVLYYCAESLRLASLALWPVMPERTSKIFDMLGLDYDPQTGVSHECQWGRLQGGSRVAKGEALFPRVS